MCCDVVVGLPDEVEVVVPKTRAIFLLFDNGAVGTTSIEHSTRNEDSTVILKL